MNNEEAWKVMLEFSQDIGDKLCMHELVAPGAQIEIKDNKLEQKQHQAQLHLVTQSPMEIARKAWNRSRPATAGRFSSAR